MKKIKPGLDRSEGVIIGGEVGPSRIRYAWEVAGLAYDNAETIDTLLLC
jgi:hypothetical protein